MQRPEFKKMFDNNYILVTLDVLENGDKKKLENPGGVDVMKELGGEQSGLPFYAFLDEKGKKLADANMMPPAQNIDENGKKPAGASVAPPAQNIGYPGSPEEILAFMDLIHKTAPRWSDADREKLKAYLTANAPKANH